MKHVFLVLAKIVLPTVLYAQIQLSGIVVDDNQNPLPYASVAMYAQADSTEMKATYTSDDGSFFFQDLYSQFYHLEIQMLGYKDRTFRLDLSESKDLRHITLEAETTLLEEVEVTAYRSMIESHLGKKILHIDHEVFADQSALDALENLPSITTTPRGEVNIRGSSDVIVYINGKATRRDPASLRFISTAALDKIEIITNPSAEHDAEGVAGIINLVYRSDNTRTFKMELISNLTARTNPIAWNPFAGINASLSKEKISIFANVNFDYGSYLNSDKSKRINLSNNLYNFKNLNQELGLGFVGNSLIGLSIEPDTTLSIGLEINFDRWKFKNDIYHRSIFEYAHAGREVVNLKSKKNELENELWISTSFEKLFSKEQNLKIALSAGGENEDNFTRSTAVNIDSFPTELRQFVLASAEKESQRYYQGELDYFAPFFNFGTIEMGVKADLIYYKIFQKIDLQADDIAVPNNDFEMNMQKIGWYMIQKNKISKVEYAVGLRLEHFSSDATQKSNQQSFVQNYTQLFPSIQLLYLITDRDHTIGLNYSRRIRRPGFFDLNPFVSYNDPLNLKTGNPALRPELANIIEVNYNLELKKMALDLTLFQRQTSNAIQSVISMLDVNTTLATSVNIGIEKSRGLETLIEYRPFNFLKTSASFTWSQNLFEDDSRSIVFNRQNTWSLRLKQQWQITDYWKLEFTERYRAPSYQIQQKRLETYIINLGVTRKFRDNSGSVSLSLRDIFNTNEYTYVLKTDNLEVERSYKWQTRQINIGLKHNLYNQ